MHEIIVADTSCLIVLERIGKIEILHRLFGTVTITHQVALEYKLPLLDWIKIQGFQNQQLFKELQYKVDIGEASAIVLATELSDSLIILDDYRAREAANKLGLKITGTLGIIIKAKEKGLIDKVKPLLDSLVQIGFRLHPNIYIEILKISGEE